MTRASLVLALAVVLSTSAQAHLMVAQKGTLNLVDNGAFMVLSVPVSAFDGVDDDSDGKLSVEEFTHHKQEILDEVKRKVILRDDDDAQTLEGIMLTPVVPDHSPDGVADQLVIMGRFHTDPLSEKLSLQVELYGEINREQSLEVTATRPALKQQRVLVLTHKKPVATVFPQ